MTNTCNCEPPGRPAVAIPGRVASKWDHAFRMIASNIRHAIYHFGNSHDRWRQAELGELVDAVSSLTRAGLTPHLERAMEKSFLPTIIQELRRLAAAGAGPAELSARADELHARQNELERQGFG